MKKLFLLIFILLVPVLCFSQIKGESKTYSLDECIEIAKKNNTEIKLADAQVEAAGADITNAFGNFLPSLNFNWGYQRQLNSSGGQSVSLPTGQTFMIGQTNPNSYNMSATASYVLFNGFYREQNYSRAQGSYNAYYLNTKFTQQRIIMNIYRQYIDVIRNSQVVKIRKDNLDLGNKDLERIKARYDAGVAPITTIYTQEADLGNRELEVIKAQNDMNIAKSTVLTTMGYSPDLTAEFLETSLQANVSKEDIDKFHKEIGDFNNIVQEALKKRLDYVAYNSIVNSAKATVSAASSGYYPTLAAQGGWSWANDEFSNFSELGRSYIGLSLSVPIFENFRTNYQIETSKLQLHQREIEQYQLEQQIRAGIKAALINLDAAEKQIEISERSLKSAEKNFESTNERYKVGSVGISDYYLANSLLVSAQINRVTSVYGYVQAQKEVIFSMGRIE